ncbi:MAG: hypothetical protein IK017_07780 [Paludibacteraceae bacterium]|nr:hypothetical protein [Paludibacteraceae bacterium]
MKTALKTLILGILLVNAPFSYAQTTITIDPTTSYQTIDGIGGGIVYYLDWLTTHKNKEVLYDTIFNGLGLTGLRIGNWAHEEDADLTYDAEIVHEGKKRLGDDFFITMSSWSAPAELKQNNSLTGSCGGPVKPTLKKEYGRYIYDKFGAWWKRALQQYRDVDVYPNTISIQNEVDCDADYESTIFDPSESNGIAAYSNALSSVYNNIKTLDNAPGILGPEVLGIGWNKVQEYINTVDKRMLYGYNFHYYHSGSENHKDDGYRYNYPDEFLGAMTNLSRDYLNQKPMYMTENSSLRDPDPNDPIHLAIFMSYAFSVNHVVSYLHWNLIWGDTGDGCINLEFSENGYKTEDGYVIQGDYHALRHYSKFIRRGWKNISAQTNNNNVIVSAFKSPEEDAYTVVLVNRNRNNQTARLPFFPEGTRATVIQSVPSQKIWSSTIGTYDALESVNMPGNSITTIAYKPKAKTYIYDCNKTDVWSTQENWTPVGVPQSIDTTIIRSGEVKAGPLELSAPITIEENGTLDITANCTFDQLNIIGGTIKSSNVNPLYLLSAREINIQSHCTIIAGPTDTTGIEIVGTISGDGDIIKTSAGILSLNAEAEQLNGSWTLEEGTISVNNKNALGPVGIFVDNGILEINVDVNTDQITISDSAKLVLKGNLEVNDLTINGQTYGGGTYTTEDYPDGIKGLGKLIVNKPLPALEKFGAGETDQTVRQHDSIIEYGYSWENADSICISWSQDVPDGICAEIDTANRTIRFYGIATTPGLYRYTITTQSSAKEEVTKNGSFYVEEAEHNPIITSTENKSICIIAEENMIDIIINSDIKENCHFMIVDMEARTKADFYQTIEPGNNKIEKKVNQLTAGTYLLQIRGKSKPKTCKFVVK